MTPLSDEAISFFPDFVRAVHNRLDRGRQDYGDSSFTRPLPEVLDELAQEALDIAGWGFVAWTRIRKLADTLTRLESASRNGDGELPSVLPADEVARAL